MLAAAAVAGFTLLLVAVFLYEPAPGPEPTGPSPSPAVPAECAPCLLRYEVELDAAAGHAAWRWDREVVVSSIDIDGLTAVMGIAWSDGEELVLEAAALEEGRTWTHRPMQPFAPLPAAMGRAYVAHDGNVTSWNWRTGATSNVEGMDVALDAAAARVLGQCGDAWCIVSGIETTFLDAPGTPGRAAALVGDVAYATMLGPDGTTLYRFAPDPEELAEDDGSIVRLAAAPGRLAWERPGGGATMLIGGVTTEVPGAARIAWAGDRLVYTVREEGHTLVMLHPGQELARFAPREDVQALTATATDVWVAGTVFVDHADVNVLIRIPVT